jgi:polysaccharide deacetylase 2 family uncharacterized protein YibQ
VAADDLSAPLGQKPKKKSRFRLPLAIPQAIAGVLGLIVAVFAAWAVVMEDPLGGEPMAVVAAPPVPSRTEMPKVEAAVAAAPGQGARSHDGPAPAQTAPPGSQTITIIDGSTGKRQEVAIPSSPNKSAPVEQRLLETSRHGSIPKIAPDGARPAEIYSRPVKAAAAGGKGDGPRIAIVIAGVGISASATQEALKLPAPVTLAFAPYAPDAERLVANARAGGHEVLLQVPMEPFDYPDNDPGPQTLLMSLSVEQNLDRLHWLMSRFQGYVGIANYMGARFTASEPALSPVLREMSKRGLIYLDDGSSPRSLASQIAGANNMSFAKAEIQLDAVPTPVNIDRALTKLEAAARDRGMAVGIASALPASIDRIMQWAKSAEARGFVLVPISAIAIKPKSS